VVFLFSIACVGLYMVELRGGVHHTLSLGIERRYVFVYGFLLLSTMVSFSSQIFLSALYVFILVTG